jgi:hypothetical protein
MPRSSRYSFAPAARTLSTSGLPGRYLPVRKPLARP